MDDRQTQRRIRQALLTDRLLGVDAVPLGSRPVSMPAPEPRLETRITPSPPKPGAGADPLFSKPPSPAQTPPMTPDEKREKLDALDRNEVRGCTKCDLCSGRTNTVFGQGDPDADLMFIGEGPGADEDAQGLPFVGRAGQLLNKQIDAMGLTREQVYIGNIVKCRPPGNRAPTAGEAEVCMPYLLRQIAIIQPKVIVALGGVAAKFLLGDPQLAITRERGQWRRFHGVDLMLTFHPAYLLRQYTKDNRAKVWSDLQKVMDRLGLAKPE